MKMKRLLRVPAWCKKVADTAAAFHHVTSQGAAGSRIGSSIHGSHGFTLPGLRHVIQPLVSVDSEPPGRRIPERRSRTRLADLCFWRLGLRILTASPERRCQALDAIGRSGNMFRSGQTTKAGSGLRRRDAMRVTVIQRQVGRLDRRGLLAGRRSLLDLSKLGATPKRLQSLPWKTLPRTP